MANERPGRNGWLNGFPSKVERILGLQYGVAAGEFVTQIKTSELLDTFKGILSPVSILFEPFGFLFLWLLPESGFLQGLCRKKSGWGYPFYPEDNLLWEKFSN